MISTHLSLTTMIYTPFRVLPSKNLSYFILEIKHDKMLFQDVWNLLPQSIAIKFRRTQRYENIQKDKQIWESTS